MLGMLIPPGSPLTADKLKYKGWFNSYQYKHFAKICIPKLLDFLQDTKLSIDEDSARAYFRVNGIEPIPMNAKAETASLVRNYPEQIKDLFEKQRWAKLRLVARVMSVLVCDAHWSSTADKNLILKLLENDKWRDTTYDTHSIFKSFLIEATFTRNNNNNHLDYHNPGQGRDESMVAKRTIRKSSLKKYMDTLIDGTSKYTSQGVFDNIVNILKVLHMCLVNTYCDVDRTDLEPREYSTILETCVRDLGDLLDSKSKLAAVTNKLQVEIDHRNDVDPMTVMMAACMQPIILETEQIEDALYKPNFQTLLCWHIIEMMALKINLKNTEVDTGIETDETDAPKSEEEID